MILLYRQPVFFGRGQNPGERLNKKGVRPIHGLIDAFGSDPFFLGHFDFVILLRFAYFEESFFNMFFLPLVLEIHVADIERLGMKGRLDRAGSDCG